MKSKTQSVAHTLEFDYTVKKCSLCGRRTEKGFVLDWEFLHKQSECPKAVAKAEGR